MTLARVFPQPVRQFPDCCPGNCPGMLVFACEWLAVAIQWESHGATVPRRAAKTYFGNVHFRWKRGKISVMSGGLIERFLSSCRHQFAWPRRAENGDYYQLCVHCGAKYMYDWSKMRRSLWPKTKKIASPSMCGHPFESAVRGWRGCPANGACAIESPCNSACPEPPSGSRRQARISAALVYCFVILRLCRLVRNCSWCSKCPRNSRVTARREPHAGALSSA